MGQDTQPGLTVQAIVDLLERHDPGFLAQKRDQHPELAGMLTAGMRLGENDQPNSGLSAFSELAARALPAARDDGERCLATLRAQAKSTARLRMGSAALTSAATVSMLALVLGDWPKFSEIAAAAVALVSSFLTLIVQYREESIGGGETVTALRSTLIESLVELERIEGDLRVEAVLPGTVNIDDLVGRLNLAVSKVRSVELAIK